MIAKSLTTLALLACSGLALAHSGHGLHHGGLASGLLHPLLGLDHLLALLAIGFWSAWQASSLKRGIAPLAMLGLVAGTLIGLAGLSLTGIEVGIALSVVLAGVLIAALARLPAWSGGLLAGLFMLVHGLAHGTEMHAGVDAAGYVTGLVIASLAMLLLGRVAGNAFARRDHPAARLVGLAVALVGSVLAVA
ncbi:MULTISPECIES: HupE/UreJ family protein [unclassified Guyparkeria]|uniref:HupE/UreJ family protein n=1 Tax=unclassified Guyparkeria TaxID=2626246 RepID=UPI00073366C4|nr:MULTISPECIES: HupE/UreJ family protein [unclassified Guyparkeria]KTG17007.1 hypothetical protein AUR63_02880 [Guyparkeria sp. XI15]OAE86041.1 hypothetical protein AWR35_02880 [Guyparkeria sp. WRN-7]